MRYAPTLQEIAGQITGRAPSSMRTRPVEWAYALRDAVDVANPDVVVSHVDDRLEAESLRAQAAVTFADLAAVLESAPPLAKCEPVAAVVELVETLAGIYRSARPVAATLTGPVTLAAALLTDGADVGERTEIAEMAADLLAALGGAYVDAGAAVLVVREPRVGYVADEAGRRSAMKPLERMAGHRRVELVVAGPGAGIAPEVWALPADEFSAAFERGLVGGPQLLLSDGAVPAAIPLENLRRGRELVVGAGLGVG